MPDTAPRRLAFFLLLLLLCLAAGVTWNGADRDLWHRLAMGRTVLDVGSVPLHDRFSYMPVKPLWIDHEWGSGVVFHALLSAFGDTSLILLRSLLLFLTLALVRRAQATVAPESRAFRPVFFLVLFLALLPGFVPTIRCQTFTFTFFALWMLGLESARRGARWPFWAMPLTSVLWANLHGGFVSGLGLIALYGAGAALEKRWPRNEAILLPLCAGVTLFNPYGLEYWRYIAEAATMRRPYITEWAALDPFGPLGDWTALKLLVLATAAALLHHRLARKKPLDRTALVVLAATLYLAVRHSRHSPFFAIAAGVHAALPLAALGDALHERLGAAVPALRRFAAPLLLGFSLLVGVTAASLAASGSWHVEVSDRLYPVGAADFIETNGLERRLLVPLNWGSYILWKLHPNVLVSMDGRYEEVYPNEVYARVTEFTFAEENWRAVLERFEHDMILVHTESRTAELLREDPQWLQVYSDATSALFIPARTPWRTWKPPAGNPRFRAVP